MPTENKNGLKVTLVIGAIFASFWYGRESGIPAQTREVHAAICALQHDIELRHEEGQKFIIKNPDGIPGIPASVIKNGLKNQESTLKAFADSGLTC